MVIVHGHLTYEVENCWFYDRLEFNHILDNSILVSIVFHQFPLLFMFHCRIISQFCVLDKKKTDLFNLFLDTTISSCFTLPALYFLLGNIQSWLDSYLAAFRTQSRTYKITSWRKCLKNLKSIHRLPRAQGVCTAFVLLFFKTIFLKVWRRFASIRIVFTCAKIGTRRWWF